ncbi:MAG: hypothetical protein ACYDBJ_08970 [Aggregatilineales bacterium]
MLDPINDFSTSLSHAEQLELLQAIQPFLGKSKTRADARYALRRFYARNDGDAPNDLFVNVAKQIDDLLASSTTRTTSERSQKRGFISIGPDMGIVTSPELLGTRIHLEFAFWNLKDASVVITDMYVILNEGQMNFKKFFKINVDGSREPDYQATFPIIVSAKGIEKLAVEFENYSRSLISIGSLQGELRVISGDKVHVSRDFVLQVDEALEKELQNAQTLAEQHNQPLIWGVKIRT